MNTENRLTSGDLFEFVSFIHTSVGTLLHLGYGFVVSRVHLQLMKLQAYIATAVVEAAAAEGKDFQRAYPNWDSNFLNMPPCELNPLDVTGLPWLDAACVWKSLRSTGAREQWLSCVPNFCLLVL